ncbi:MAG: aminopeptidase P family protein [Firmicutes bacterium]|nr:aminopeptidase P family protein [Bacillota bacterium]
MTVQERLAALRKIMSEKNIDAYLIPTDDFHGSEYVGDYFKCRKFISGFTGSAGSVVVTMDKAGLWTDGRYFLQGAAQLEGSTIDLYKMGEPGVPTIPEFLASELPDCGTLGFDGRTIIGTEASSLKKALDAKNISFAYDEDLVGMIWDDRPSLPEDPAWILTMGYAGESRDSKLAKVRRKMNELGVDSLVLTSLDDIMWLFNIRGNDVECNPVVLSYAYITDAEAILFMDEGKFPNEARAELVLSGIKFRAYNDIYEFVKGISGKVLVDDEKVNYTIISNLERNEKSEIVIGENPTFVLKAVKNDTEIEHMRKTHIKDGIATTKLIYWLKHRDKSVPVTEIDVAEKMEEFRGQQEGYMGPSFGTIAGYGPNGAIIHYGATPETNATLKDEGFILVDTGGFYMGGTTDITRTIALGPLKDIEKVHYTAVLRGHLNLGSAVFPAGMKGVNLDTIARKPVWEVGCDYKHGTGHGVGFMLNVHEGPNSIRNALTSSRTTAAMMVENMITSNEPGIYIAGSHGIRIETLLLTVRETAETDVPMLKFETLTLVPYERDAIVIENMTAAEIKVLNDYHKRVYEVIAPHLDEEERDWLAEVTKEL